MRKNTVLAAAITTALSMNVVYAGTFANWPTTCASDPCGAASGIAITGAAAALTSGETVVKSAEKGIIFGSHLFGSSAVELPTGTADYYFGAKYDLVGEVDFPFEFKVSLSNSAQFEGTAKLEFVSNGTNGTSLNGGNLLSANCDSKTICQWSVTPSTGGTLKDGDMFVVLYRIKNAQALANPGEKITLTAQLGTTFTPALIDTREITVATGADPLAIGFEPGTDTGIRISVSSQNTEFSSRTTGSSEFTSPQAVTIGYLKAQKPTDPVVAADGFTTWDLGNTNTATGKGGADAFNAEYNSTNKVDTSLTITGGQFAASVKGSTGKVYLDVETAKTGCAFANYPDGTGFTPTSTAIEAESVDENNATWLLSNSELQDIVRVSSECAPKKIPIVVKTDGTTGINTVENPPTAAFTLDYAETNNLHDIAYGPVELSRFKADGTICWVYNVPGSAAADTLALRVTNDSSSAGVINGTLYDKDGAQIFPAEGNPPLNLLGEGVELQAGETKAIFSTTLEALGGDTPFTWTGRGILQISSTLSRLEVLTLIRSADGVATNLSTGANGAACSN